MKKLRTVFMGTPDFAVPSLAKLHEITAVAAVVTQPDKPRGRGKKLSPSPVKMYAVQKELPVYQPFSVKSAEFLTILEELAPDLIVVVAFGQILSPVVLAIPRLGCINVHASLLPRYRGAAPMQWCLINGEKVTGVTTMFMDAGLDTGDMLQKIEVPIPSDMTLAELHDILSERGAELLTTTVLALQQGTLRREKQDDAASNYAPMITKLTGKIDWTQPAEAIHNLVRGLDSWPGAYATLEGQVYKIWRTRVVGEVAKAAVGEIVKMTEDGFIVGTGQGLLEVLELQAPGKKRMTAKAYIHGHPLRLPCRFA